MKELVSIRSDRMTASEAARRMGVSRQQIYNLENATQGVPSVVSVERYAKAVGARIVVMRLASLPR
jgi:transcriptional regulator with XRE-family HTH domain